MTVENKFGMLSLPPQVQHLNSRDDFYLVGTGLVVAGGGADGKWGFIAGPHYTCSNYIEREEIRIIIDGQEHALDLKMHRARGTGVYYGMATVGEITVTVVDGACRGETYLSRAVLVDNNSASKEHIISIKTHLTLISAESGIKDACADDSDGVASGVVLCQGTTLFSFQGTQSKWVPNWADRFLLVAYNEAPETIYKVKNTYVLQSKPKRLSAGGSHHIALAHYLHYTDLPESDYIGKIRSMDALKNVAASIDEWQTWFNNAGSVYALDKIKDQRARDIVEGSLTIIKTNQTVDGGFVSDEIWADMAWTRDAYCGLRGLLACGHTQESGDYLNFMHHKYMMHGFIPNASSCGRDTFALYNGNPANTPRRQWGGACPEANSAPETPALYMLVARDYLAATGDLAAIKAVHGSLQYSMDVQLKHAVANGYRLEFSGDETELCGAVTTLPAGYDYRYLENYWSMSSLALCIASLEFYIDYLKKRNDNPESYISIYGTVYNLNSVLENLKETFEKDFWRTDNAEQPQGYHEWCRLKADNSFPKGRIVNLTLFPWYYRVNVKHAERVACDVDSVKGYFLADKKTLPLVPVLGDNRYLGHDLGYLLWCLVQVKDPFKEKIYDALVNGTSAQRWGSFNECYDADGKPNAHNLRTFETGVNIDALAKYWKLGL
ncbi:MAG: hypothetical protein PHC61_18025 [Chitinivibrionales bacterium]|nr:hypothetical protein [Chitinivibrionales bacterium]